MSDIQRDREERQHVIEILQEEKKTALHDNKWAFDYAIASIKTDLKYDLLYEETSGQADKPTTKNDLGVDFKLKDYVSREAVRRIIKSPRTQEQMLNALNSLRNVTECKDGSNEVLDKIRAEIKELPTYDPKFVETYTAYGMKQDVLEIVDKYKGETENP